ncbi:hypothetical protein AVEN_164587-1 [Araneus ventricosus]|uniref:Uncharacterized protein n=1 Tax=Araneus ventricosus TaxID=182803 RepID=A0A4Y2B4P5_ARAVE|nr:hypothetical protein AVEN_164587-1 [Araneus ventricosus]
MNPLIPVLAIPKLLYLLQQPVRILYLLLLAHLFTVFPLLPFPLSQRIILHPSLHLLASFFPVLFCPNFSFSAWHFMLASSACSLVLSVVFATFLSEFVADPLFSLTFAISFLDYLNFSNSVSYFIRFIRGVVKSSSRVTKLPYEQSPSAS